MSNQTGELIRNKKKIPSIPNRKIAYSAAEEIDEHLRAIRRRQ